MSPLLSFRNGLMVFSWAAALLAVLSIANLPGSWGHAVCGVWGCGPPLQALVSCHAAWLLVLGPLVEMVTRSAPRPSDLRFQMGKVLLAVGAILVVVVAVHQRISWWPTVSEFHQQYFWNRCGFVIITSVDVPITPILILGAIFLWWGFPGQTKAPRQDLSTLLE